MPTATKKRKPLSPLPPLEPGKQWFTRAEAAQYLTISFKSLKRLVAEGKLSPHHITAQRVAFNRKDLDAYAKRKKA
jgi:excisionase family DNA binding protein